MPSSPRWYVDRAVARNEQIFPARSRADVGIGPYENAVEVLSARGRYLHRPVGTLIERSQKANKPFPQGLGSMWASAPTNRITQLLRWEACAAPHPAGLRPATLPHVGRLLEKNPPPGVQCTWEGEYLTAPSGARCGGRRGRGWGISPVCPAAYRKPGPVCSAH